MVLSKDEFASLLRTEMRILAHLAAKVDAATADFRPTPKQRSLLELLQYLTIMGPIQLRGVLADSWSIEGWREEWQTEQPKAKRMDLEAVKQGIAALPALFAELLAPFTDADLRAGIEMFGQKASRGTMLVSLVLNHYTAYRMQLFLYLKSAGHEELNTMNLWAGIDMPL